MYPEEIVEFSDSPLSPNLRFRHQSYRDLAV